MPLPKLPAEWTSFQRARSLADLPCDVHGVSYGKEVCPDCLREFFVSLDAAVNLPPRLRAAAERLRPDEDEDEPLTKGGDL